MSSEQQIVVRSRDSGAVLGVLWPIGWLFTIGYCHLGFAKGALALLFWPYFLGATLRG